MLYSIIFHIESHIFIKKTFLFFVSKNILYCYKKVYFQLIDSQQVALGGEIWDAHSEIQF